MATNQRHPILSSRIPDVGFGRQITTTERGRLKNLGLIVPVKTRVTRVFGVDYVGSLYAPQNGGMVNLAISVTTIPGA